MGENERDKRGSNQEAIASQGFSEQIDFLYDEGIQVGLLFSDMYKMDLYELMDTIEYRRKGLGYAIWRLASLTRSPWVQNFPEKPEDACPELFPKPKGIPMPDWVMKKYIKREVNKNV